VRRARAVKSSRSRGVVRSIVYVRVRSDRRRVVVHAFGAFAVASTRWRSPSFSLSSRILRVDFALARKSSSRPIRGVEHG